MLKRSLILILILCFFVWGCPINRGKDKNSKNLELLLGLYLLNETNYYCAPEENIRTSGDAPNFSVSNSGLSQVLLTESGGYQDGGTAYLVGTVKFPGIGKNNPMGIVYAEQNHQFSSNLNRFIYPLWTNASGDLIQDSGKSESLGYRSVTTAFPIGATPGYYAPSSNYNNFNNNLLGANFIVPTAPGPLVATRKITNNTAQTCEEYKFRADQNGLLGSSSSGLKKVWQSRKKLNINLIFIQNAVATPTTAGMATMIQTLKDIYAQDTVKIDVTVTTSLVPAAAGAPYLTVANISDDYGDVVGSLGSLYRNNPSNVQDSNSLNIYVTRDYQISSSAPAGILGISSGIPGIPVNGTPKSGMVVFIENHRTSSGCGVQGQDLICESDQVFLAKTIAHEAGHYLGLYHLVEKDVVKGRYSLDPLPETPECKDQNGNNIVGLGECLGEGFYDSGGLNLMFWAGNPKINQTQLTGEQGWVLRSHPLVY
ncbi:M43 family metalopeptidase leptolysin [Leptospira borgpetersenii]|uniref:M43 family metalopeptidase leptolysin n=1 Tax=Leptospira borgpetersenii TaxID=174 RepID=UPI0007734AC3|nr:pappalysin-1 domain protein [Leptospira borgpetersenii]MBF3377595.1 pappalysin-1 domain protein [Leptospira borgpetersenii serovar Balcanica]